ncbi:hypothetical protein [Hyphomicrobium sp. DY-1]|uniref:hypothetical protein n=1 Tax=Hyphomicrobium sp. DY-1 TaxID=3075650 RepID=UPI0039C26E71
MANYVSICRSNYFKVQDEKRFIRWCAFWGLDHWTDTPDGLEGTFHAIANENGDGWPSSHPETGDDIDFEAELQQQLLPETVAILVSADHEGLRFVGGHACALHADGRSEYISLRSIQDKARDVFGPDITITEAIF